MKVARPVLRGPRRSNALGLPDKQATGFYLRLKVDTTASGAVSQAGGVLLTETIAATDLGRELSAGLAPWRKPLAVHDPAKVLTDLAVTLALGGDCLADVAVLRAEPGVYGRVASDPTVSRTIDALAKNAPAAYRSCGTSGDRCVLCRWWGRSDAVAREATSSIVCRRIGRASWLTHAPRRRLGVGEPTTARAFSPARVARR